MSSRPQTAAAPAGTPTALAPLVRIARRLSLNDWIVLAYLILLNASIALAADPGPARDQGLIEMSLLLFAFLVAVVIGVRGGLLTHRWAAPFCYRLGHFGSIQFSYFSMRGFLPVVNPTTLDRELHQLGVSSFGVEPALAFEAWVSSTTTEWFAFFYYGYFFVLALHVLPIVFGSRNARILSEFALGLTVLLAVGQSTYLLVPGYGPANGLPELFERELPEGIWWNLVVSIVESGGAQKDIFPSIHTAAPTFILLFSCRNRAYLPYRYSWALLALFVPNIILATMFLRWHWLVDIVAGIALASFAFYVAVAGTRWELAHREREGLPPAWPRWPLPRPRT